MGKLRVVLSGVLVLAVLFPPGASAATPPAAGADVVAAGASTLVVNTTTDRRLQDGDVNCVDPGWTCSLRAAVQEANANPAYDTIVVPAGGYVLTRAGTSADGSSGALRLASSVTIVGAGPGLTVIDAGWRTSIPGSGTGDRVVDAVSGSSTIEGATIRGGIAPGGSLVEDRGGGVHVRPGASLTLQDAVVDGSRAGQGGGIHNAGTLRLVRSEVRGNRGDSQGGGIHASGPVDLLRSVVASNTSVSPGGGLSLTSPTSTPVESTIRESTVELNSSGNAGGGLGVGGSARLELVASTVRGNAAATGGGAFSLVANGGLTAVNSTISGNTASNGTGGIVTSSSVSPRLVQVTIADNARTGSGASALQVGATSAPVEIESSILTAPAAVTPLCIGAVVSSGYNLARDDSCQLTQASDRPQTDPQLGPLADNGGPTVTHLPLSGSPVIDAGPTVAGDCIERDQRGALRPAGPRCDVGSVEFGAVFPDAPAEVPGAPGEIVTRVGDGTIGLSWQPPADDGGAPITGYVLQIAPPPLTGPATVPLSTSRTVVEGLQNGVEHTFSVRAVNAVGEGPASQAVRATPEVVWYAVGAESTSSNFGRSARWNADASVRTDLGPILAGGWVAYGVAHRPDGRWVAVGGSGRVSFSDDARTWHDASAGVPTNGTLRAVEHDGEERWVAVGSQGIVWSSDGETWELATAPSGAYLDVAFGDGRWVAVGHSGTVVTSDDGATWSAVAYPTTGTVRTVAHGDGIWATGTGTGEVATSPDGLTWTTVTSPSTGAILDLAHGAGRWIAIDASDKLHRSTDDGQSWITSSPSVPWRSGLLAAHHRGGVWMVVGDRIDLRSTDHATWGTTRQGSEAAFFEVTTTNVITAPPPLLPPADPDPDPADIAARLVGLEVNQAVQDWGNTVPLFTDKATTVRAFVEVPDGAEPIRLTGLLRAYRLGEELPWSPLAPDNPAGAIQARPDILSRRGVWDDSLNFRLPWSWLRGDVELRFETPDATLSCAESAPPAGTCSTMASFSETNPLDVTLVDVGWSVTPTSGEQRPTAVDMNEQAARLRDAFPVSRYAPRYRSLPLRFTGEPALWSVNHALKAMRVLDGCEAGCGRVYAGYIVGSAPSSTIGQASGAVSTTYSQGTEAPTAMHPMRNVLPHEVAHSLGVPHVVHSDNALPDDDETSPKRGWCGEVAGSSTSDWPYRTTGFLVRPALGPMDDVEAEVWGAVPRFMRAEPRLAQVSPHVVSPMMSYCTTRALGQGLWIAEPTYRRLLQRIGFRLPSSSAPAPVPELAASASSDDEVEQLLVRVTVPLEEQAVIEVAEFETVLRASLPPSGEAADPSHLLVLRGGAGQVLAEVAFELEEVHGFGGDDPGIGQAIAAVPVPDDPVARIEVVETGEVVGAIDASPAVPTVTVDTPVPGSTVGSDGSVQVSWTGTDDDGDELSYSVRVSADDGGSWQTVAVDLTATELEVPLSQLRATTTARLQVIASDGVNSSYDEVAPFTIVDAPPQVTIVHPLAGQVVAGEQLLDLSAIAVDAEDGELDGDAVRWTSDRDGPVGSGAEVTVPAATLSEGEHELTVTATDTAGASSVASVRVLVSRAYAPLASEPLPSGEPAALQVTDAAASLGTDEPFDITLQIIDAVGDHVEVAGFEVALTQLGGDPRLEPPTPTATSDAAGVVRFDDLRFTGPGGSVLLEATADGLPAVLLRIEVDGDDPPPAPVLDCELVTPASFTDVPSGSTHAGTIGCLAAIDVLRGRGDGTFAPAETLTRGQAASLVFRSLQAAGLPLQPADEPAFGDVAGSVHAGTIGALAELGIVQGRTETTYEPSAPVTRAQLISLIVRASAALGVDTTPVPPPYSDVAGSVHADNIGWAADVGIAQGFADGTFGPSRSVTRAQSASFVVRWLSTIER